VNDEENLTLHQKSLKASFHTPLQLQGTQKNTEGHFYLAKL